MGLSVRGMDTSTLSGCVILQISAIDTAVGTVTPHTPFTALLALISRREWGFERKHNVY